MVSTPGGPSKTRTDKVLLSVLRGERRDPPPAWMMRQAGRYLPEYRLLREQKGGFLDLVYDSDAAAEITLQPLERFPALDAAILFSDILIVPFAIGQNLSFVAGEGPRLTPPLTNAALDQLTPVLARLEPIYETVRKVRERLGAGKALIGFAGSPWTVATYMVAGQGSREQAEARRLAYADPKFFGEIISRIEEVTLEYLSGQIAAGAEAVQLFDSWAGSLSPAQFEQWVIAPTARIVAGRTNCRDPFQYKAISTRSRSLPVEKRCAAPLSISLTHSPTVLTSSISGTASCRTRRSPTLKRCSIW